MTELLKNKLEDRKIENDNRKVIREQKEKGFIKIEGEKEGKERKIVRQCNKI